MPLSSRVGTVSDRIADIGGSRIPTEIGQSIVRWISIVVAPMLPFGTRTDESSEDKGM
jgi:hypothetical protein